MSRERDVKEHQGRRRPEEMEKEPARATTWEAAVPGVQDVLDPRLAHPANLERRAALLRVGQRDLGNTAVQRLISSAPMQQEAVNRPPRVPELTDVVRQGLSQVPAGLPVVQLALPPISEPKVTGAPTFDAAALAAVGRCQKGTCSEPDGKAAVAAATKWLEDQGTVQFTGQQDIVPGSPEFRRSPSTKADDAARESGTSLSNTAGFVYGYDAPQGKQRYKVEIYPYALGGDSADEGLRFLTSVIGHEYVHVLQNRAGGKFSVEQREFQAWLWQAERAVTLGIQPLSGQAAQIAGQLSGYYNKLKKKDKDKYKQRFQSAWKGLQEQPQAGSKAK